MEIELLGKRWRLADHSRPGCRGSARIATVRNKEIRVDSQLRGEERLEVLIHEMVHAAGWHIDEQFVERFAEGVSRALWRLGYRNGDERDGRLTCRPRSRPANKQAANAVPRRSE